MARDPNYWPFDTYSPWNLPIGSGIAYESAGSAMTNFFRTYASAYGAGINCQSYSVPCYDATSSDPLVTITDVVHGGSTQIRIPAGASAAVGTDSNCSISQPNGRLYDIWGLRWTTMNVALDCDRYNYTLNTSTGFGPQAGIRACGCNSRGGLIRRWEIEPTDPRYTDGVIRHPIAIAIDWGMLLYTGGTSGYDANGYGTAQGRVWPATEQDWGSEYQYGGSIPMGSFWAIPKSVNVAGLGLNASVQKIAKAVQDYGAYVVDQATGMSPTFYAEPTCAGTAWLSAAQTAYSQLTIVRQNMVHVTNNTPTSINGGGTPLLALAPQIGTGGTPPPSTRPDETNTGYLPTGQTLTAYTGPTTITTAQTITGKSITGSLIISGVAVTISKSKITMTAGGTGIGVTTTNGGSLLIVDTEVDGVANNTATATGIDGPNVTVTRCNVHHCVWGVRLRTNCVVETSYVHDLKLNPGSDPVGVGGWGSNTACIVRNNSIIATGADATAALYLSTGVGSGDSSDISVTGNYLSGGHSNAYFGSWRTGNAATATITGLVVTGNTFVGDNDNYAANGNTAIYPIDGHTTITTWSANVSGTGATIPQPANTSGSGSSGGGGGGGTTLATGVVSAVSGGPVIKLNSTSALVSGSPFTMMIWHKPTIGQEFHGLFGAMQPTDAWTTGGGQSDGWGMHVRNLGLHNFYHGATGYGAEPAPDTSLTLLTLNQWGHIAVIVRPGTNAMSTDCFVNGNFIQTISDTGPAWPTGLQPLVGSIDGSPSPAAGGFACWRVWNAALTQAEISAEMHSLTALKSGAIVDIDFTSASATNRGSGGAWSQQATIGTWSFSSEGVVTGTSTPTDPGGGTVTPTYTFSDNFNRPNSTSTLGSPWVVTGGVWGVVAGTGAASGTAYSVSGNPAYATVDTGQVEQSISAKMNAAKNDCQGLIVRYVDPGNYIMMIPATAYATWNINKIVNYTTTFVGNMGLTGFDYRTTLSAKGTTITASVLDATQGLITKTFTITDSILQAGTRVGMRWGETNAPTVPLNPTALATSATSIKIDWSASSGPPTVSKYNVYRNGSITPLAQVNSPTITYTDTTCLASTTYTYEIASLDSRGMISARSAVVTATTPSAATGGGTRNGFYWPFDSNSPWNLPIGNNVTLESTGAARTQALRTSPTVPWLNCDQYSHPVYKAVGSDPILYMTDTEHGEQSRNVYIPSNAVVAPGEDHHLHVLQPNGWEMVEMWTVNLANRTSGRIESSNIYGDGIGPQSGTRAYGGSAIGGLIRAADVVPGAPGYIDGVIRHALALAIPASMLYYNGVGNSGYDAAGYGTARGYVWPATEQDWGSEGWYSGNIPMGQYFCIPKATNINGLGLTASGLKVAKALQDYGGYVTDQSNSFSYYLEPSASGSTFYYQILNGPDQWNAPDLTILRNQLVCVTNNSNTNRNGGGTRPISLAPPLA